MVRNVALAPAKTFSVIYWFIQMTTFLGFCFTAVLQSVKSESERQTQLRSDAETKLKDAETQLRSIQAKSKQLINGMQSQLEEQSNARVSARTIKRQGKCKSNQTPG